MSKIYITSCDMTPEGGRAQKRKMLELYEFSDKTHYITDDPVSAEYILICDAVWENYGKKIRDNKLLREHPNKCFILSNQDNPYYYARGVLTSAEKSGNFLNRYRTTSYSAYYDPYHNPFILLHPAEQQVIGGKDFLFSFVGRNSHTIRDAIFKQEFNRKDIFINNTSDSFNLWDFPDRKLQEEYYNILLRSKFALCPRGFGVNSIRLFEAMKLGVSPVIVSNDFMLPLGPKWDDFAIIVNENDILEIETIVENYENKYQEMGYKAKENFEKYFSDTNYFNYVIENIEDIAAKQIVPEVVILYFLDAKIFFKRISGFITRAKNRSSSYIRELI
ncbi:exostosin family protein [Pontibacter sp. SGAir0037]|uniref:exostosin domain-containing protein n=1 Tax=Pontibacter sp. SGAir0037 TaxID=2571030 RepID=UPI0010CCD3B8|nr:exostosin family protein [Pontibacter sp. SGAir0037]QCR22175.1 hypothetical protein C1N53_07355 [Pontibacter sp. SGAir0037]